MSGVLVLTHQQVRAGFVGRMSAGRSLSRTSLLQPERDHIVQVIGVGGRGSDGGSLHIHEDGKRRGGDLGP